MEISSTHASTSTRNIDMNLYMNIYISMDKDGDFCQGKKAHSWTWL